MRKIKEVLRLTFDKKMSQHKIAKSLSLSSGVINKYLQRFKDSGLLWPLPPEMSETALQDKLKVRPIQNPKEKPSQIDFQKVRQELGRKHVTLLLLYTEMGGEEHLGLSYSQFCRRYQEWQKRIKPSMRQIHQPGDKVFVDYAGTTIEILSVDGEILKAQIFVGILGASNYTYAEATLSQSLPDWIGSHVRMFEFFGGAPNMVVSDNLKSGVKKTCRYEPDINPAYAQMIEYYSSSCMPARPYTPKDKAKAENAVGIISRWIIARLRNETFIGLEQLNRRIDELLEDLNHRPFKKLPGCRHSAFVELDQPALKALPLNPYEFKEYKKARVNIDYHIELDGHYYSVPYRFIKKEIEVWFGRNMVECLVAGEVIAKHLRSYVKGQHTTRREHMPEGHRAYSEWSPERFKTWALSMGPSTGKVIEALLISRPHIEQAYRSCMGVLGLAKKYSPGRLESACQYALKHHLLRYQQIKTILERSLDLKKPFIPETMPLPFDHQNVRGANYYH